MDKVFVPKHMSEFLLCYRQAISRDLIRSGIVDLEPSYGNILRPLFENEHMTMKELAKATNRDKSTITVLVRNLEKKGYVEIVVNEKDRRSKIITLTDKAKGMKDDMYKITSKVNKEVWKDVSHREQEAFMGILEKIIGNIKE